MGEHQREQNKEYIQKQIEIRSETPEQEGTVLREPNPTGARPKYKPMTELRRNRRTEVDGEVMNRKELQSQSEKLKAEPQTSEKTERERTGRSGIIVTHEDSEEQSQKEQTEERSRKEQTAIEQSQTEQTEERSGKEQTEIEQSQTEQTEEQEEKEQMTIE